ncbi:hypothetical protein ATANTOWER_003124 [Ataeniobius toweri]|uniref:Uncharacterized protein n=1 Tax=Ataeniobius toweri TaxID=208326 RepID=A0ABU7ALT2_9TELE|nr:hypothetical protein [Ataeniobius toweri]
MLIRIDSQDWSVLFSLVSLSYKSSFFCVKSDPDGTKCHLMTHQTGQPTNPDVLFLIVFSNPFSCFLDERLAASVDASRFRFVSVQPFKDFPETNSQSSPKPGR